MLRSLLTDTLPDAERPLHTPQDEDIDAVRDAFRENLIAMVQLARKQAIPVFLSTLPTNPRYEGNIPGRPIEGYEHPSNITFPPCIERAQAALTQKETLRALELAERCQHVEALRIAGLAYWERGDHTSAKTLLDQYMELEPRNRCRPSFQAIIREVAQSLAVPLIDLERATIQAAPHGVPGPELFVDYCHMNWKGQALVADTMFRALKTHKVHPKGYRSAPTESANDRAEVFRRESTNKPKRGW